MLVEAFETGGKRYTSLENALTAAQDGDTITLRGPLDIENEMCIRDRNATFQAVP